MSLRRARGERLDQGRPRGAFVQLIDETAAAGVRIVEIDLPGEDLAAQGAGVVVRVDVDAALLQDDVAQTYARPGLIEIDHASAALLYHRRVTDELEGVAIALLGMQEDGAPIQVRSVPKRLVEITRLGRRFAFPAPFMTFPALLEITRKQVDKRQIEVGFGEVRFEDEGSAVIFGCLIE